MVRELGLTGHSFEHGLKLGGGQPADRYRGKQGLGRNGYAYWATLRAPELADSRVWMLRGTWQAATDVSVFSACQRRARAACNQVPFSARSHTGSPIVRGLKCTVSHVPTLTQLHLKISCSLASTPPDGVCSSRGARFVGSGRDCAGRAGYPPVSRQLPHRPRHRPMYHILAQGPISFLRQGVTSVTDTLSFTPRYRGECRGAAKGASQDRQEHTNILYYVDDAALWH